MMTQVDRPEPIRRVLWAANLRSKSIAERVSAAESAGFSHISMFPIDFFHLLEQGQSPTSIRRLLESSGIRVSTCDPFTQWVPRWTLPSGYPDEYVQFVNFDEDFLFAMAGAVGADSINCVEPFGVRYESEELSDSLGEFAERAAKHGVRITHEFMPISGVPDLESGWAVVKPLDPGKVGLTLDTWHFARSNSDPALLERIPGERIFEVQLADALKSMQGDDLTTDLLQFRRLPGDGELDIQTPVNILKRTGGWKSVGPEVFSNEMDTLNAPDAARKCAEALDRFLA